MSLLEVKHAKATNVSKSPDFMHSVLEDLDEYCVLKILHANPSIRVPVYMFYSEFGYSHAIKAVVLVRVHLIANITPVLCESMSQFAIS